MLSRRQFLRVSATGGAIAGLAACGGTSAPGDPDANAPGPDAPPGSPDAANACVATRSDALGPFFLAGAPMRVMIADAAEPGERLHLTGRILGADCTTPVQGVHIEVWQCDKDGAYHSATEQYRLRGWVTTDADGAFEVLTIMPGRYVQGTGPRPAHVHFTFTHPDHRTLTTQIYFADDPFLNPNDSCGTCGSDDDERILARDGDAVAGWTAAMTIKLAAA